MEGGDIFSPNLPSDPYDFLFSKHDYVALHCNKNRLNDVMNAVDLVLSDNNMFVTKACYTYIDNTNDICQVTTLVCHGMENKAYTLLSDYFGGRPVCFI